MKRTILWLVFLFCVYKSLDTFVLSGRLLEWIRQKAAQGTSQGQTIRQTLKQEVETYANPQSIYLVSGRVLEGEVIQREDKRVTVRQRFGHTGYLDETFRPAEIKEVVDHHQGPLEITPEEVAIKREFPEFHIVRRANHTFFTDSDYFFIERIVDLLEKLHKDFFGTFGSLAKGRERQRSYVLIFGDEQHYQRYAKKISAALEHSAGFYTFRGKRLALYNQFQSALFGDWEREVGAIRGEIKQRLQEAEQYRGREPEKAYRATEAVFKAQERLGHHQKRINAIFDETTVMVILHEGSHQLFHASGLHATPLARVPWLVEGLATYCETPDFGEPNRMRQIGLAELLRTNTLVPLPQFLKEHSETVFIEQGEGAYAQAWSFIYFLMKRHRQEFFRYLERVNQPSKSFLAPKEAPVQWLEEALGKSLPEIEREWREFIRTIT